jgi:hypothetical protein
LSHRLHKNAEGEALHSAAYEGGYETGKDNDPPIEKRESVSKALTPISLSLNYQVNLLSASSGLS